jgi:hypothetical protein
VEVRLKEGRSNKFSWMIEVVACGRVAQAIVFYGLWSLRH